MFTPWSLPVSLAAFSAALIALLVSGPAFLRAAEQLASRTGLGQALVGSFFLGAVTSLPGLVLLGTASPEWTWLGVHPISPVMGLVSSSPSDSAEPRAAAEGGFGDSRGFGEVVQDAPPGRTRTGLGGPTLCAEAGRAFAVPVARWMN